jgi:hypothetical protein
MQIAFNLSTKLVINIVSTRMVLKVYRFESAFNIPSTTFNKNNLQHFNGI